MASALDQGSKPRKLRSQPLVPRSIYPDTQVLVLGTYADLSKSEVHSPPEVLNVGGIKVRLPQMTKEYL